MSVQAMLDQVESICKAITGVAASVSQGAPEPIPPALAPLCFLEVREPQYTRLTSGKDGVLETRYTILITLVLGGHEMPPKRATDTARPFFERFRQAFWANPTLGGACWSSELSRGATNLRGYRHARSLPRIEWRLTVRELTTAAGVAITGLASGQVAYVAIGTPGAETDISAYCSAAGYDEVAAEHDNTPYGATAESSVPGLARGAVQLAGMWDATMNTLLAGLRRVPGKSIVLGPAGSGAGKAKISATGYLRDYAIDLDQQGGPVSWRAFFRATGPFSFGNF